MTPSYQDRYISAETLLLLYPALADCLTTLPTHQHNGQPVYNSMAAFERIHPEYSPLDTPIEPQYQTLSEQAGDDDAEDDEVDWGESRHSDPSQPANS